MEGHQFFDALDYSVFAVMLILSALIGVYFAFFAKRKQNTTSEYLMGGKKMGIFPISMSLIASYISGIALLGLPSEMYTYGTQFWMIIIGEFLSAFCMVTIYIPVFYALQILSSYEYLRQRFDKTVRTLGSVLFLVKMSLYIPIVIYVPALAFAQVTGFSLYILIPIVCLVCIFYTTLGGIKAVVWTDTLQMMLMLFGVITVAILGTYDVGGVQTVWERNKNSGRIEFFNMDWDPRIRHTFWNLLIGKFFQHLAGCTVNQAMVQRCLAMPSLLKARITIAIFAVGIVMLVSMCCYTGLVIFAAFHDCDPVKAKLISKSDQLLPYFVMKITSHIPGLPGIFVAGVFSAALRFQLSLLAVFGRSVSSSNRSSGFILGLFTPLGYHVIVFAAHLLSGQRALPATMSTGLNSMTGVILQDIIRPLYKKPLSEARASFYMKLIVVFLGVIFVVLAIAVDSLGGLIQTSSSLSGITAGTLLGIFTLGMLFPWANAKGAVVGGLCSAALVGWISIGTQIEISKKRIVFPEKPVSTEGCDNITLAHYYTFLNKTETSTALDTTEPFPIYTISYVYYTLIGVVTAIVVGLVVSFLTGANDPSEMDPKLFAPVIHRFLNTKHDRFAEEKLLEKRQNFARSKREIVVDLVGK